MRYLVDTNVLLRIIDRTSPQNRVARGSASKLRQDGHELLATSQNYAELWNVATRPVSQNGLGLSTAEADRMLRIAERICPLLPDSPAAYPAWRRLVVAYSVSGVQVHDTRIVAAMLVHGITHILTFNTSDFARFAPEGIAPVDPATV